MFKNISKSFLFNKTHFKNTTSKKELVDSMIDYFYKKSLTDKNKINNILNTKKLTFLKEGMILSFQLLRKVYTN